MAEDLMRDLQRRRATIRGARTTDAEVIKDLDELDVRAGERSVVADRSRVSQAGTKLQQARHSIENVPRELGQLTAGIEQQLLDIGYTVQEARSFTAWERFLLALGMRDKAELRRLTRLEKQELKETIVQLTKLFSVTIEELGEIEEAYREAVKDYAAGTALAIQKLKAAQPDYDEAVAAREALDGKIKTLELELQSGTVDAVERPQKEEELETLKQEYHEVHLLETDRLVVIKIANEAIVELQKNRDAALETIKSIHGMRRQLLEKFENFKSIFENSMIAVKSAARIERFNAVDPAFNKTVAVITEMNVKVAGGAVETFVTRLERATLDPEFSLQLAQELSESVREFLERVEAIAVKAEQGRGAAPSVPEDGDGLDPQT